MWDRLQNLKWTLASYGGSLYAMVLGLWSKAAYAVEHPDEPLPLTTSELIGIGGLCLVALRLAFDVWTYLDKRGRE